MSIDDFAELNLIKKVVKKNNKYSVNNTPFQTLTSLLTFLFKQRNITLNPTELKDYLDQFAKKEKISEKDIQKRLHSEIGGVREVHTPVGYIDILTDTEIVEVKLSKDFKHSLGQVLSYHKYYPDRRCRVHLFGDLPKNMYECFQLCQQHNVRLTYESF